MAQTRLPFKIIPFLFSAVQHERGPRNSTIRRQVAMYLKETSELSAAMIPPQFRPPFFPGMIAPEGSPIPAMTPSLEHLPALPNGLNGVLLQPTPKVYKKRLYFDLWFSTKK